ncbi:uncharacterized protein BXZ73DRAFT_106726 [Epithele typhae]|uniref:uncharacterized protein n=1 Tax=Epithele typhae TaxID=378194 RepID=UPI002007FE20|nr:uncharacterized protein BXZ73DRAFT_106726 [Epithele typhae]KAH9914079.1 hypothetical protein BXZ73DRAFT_106726 [Epithele typhae]
MPPKSLVQRLKRASAAFSGLYGSRGGSTTSVATTLVGDSKAEEESVQKKTSFKGSRSARPLRRTPAPWPEDVLARVFACFDPQDDDDQRTCLQAAFVCRGWSEPALGVVWFHLPHLGPLWPVFLDDDFPEIEGEASLIKNIRMSISILDTESFRDQARQAKFARLARRVRSIVNQQLTEGESTILTELLFFDEMVPILPNLTHLIFNWHGNFSEHPIVQEMFNSQALCMCIPPTLPTLIIMGQDEDGECFPGQEWLEASFDLVHDFAGSSLNHVVFMQIPHDALWAIAALKPFECLCNISIHQPISPSVLRSLGSLEALSDIAMNCSYTNDWDGVTPIDLPTLRTLTVHQGPSTMLSQLLKALQAPTLSRLIMLPQNDDVDTLDELRALVAAVAAPPSPPPVPLAEFLRPWLALPQLRDLTLRCRDPTALAAGDEDYLALACAWPGLRVLDVQGCGRGPRRDGPDPSRATNYHFGLYCRQLRTIRIGGLAPFSVTQHRTKELREAEMRKLQAQGRLRLRAKEDVPFNLDLGLDLEPMSRPPLRQHLNAAASLFANARFNSLSSTVRSGHASSVTATEHPKPPNDLWANEESVWKPWKSEESPGYAPLQLGEGLIGQHAQYKVNRKLGWGTESSVWLVERVASEVQRALRTVDPNRDVLLVRRVVLQILHALSCVHQLGYIHGDVKADNICVPVFDELIPDLKRYLETAPAESLPPRVFPDYSPDPVTCVKTQPYPPIGDDHHPDKIYLQLADFSSAIRTSSYSTTQRAMPRMLRAPEVILGRRWGQPIDIWALGCLAAELLLRRPLFYPGDNEDDATDGEHLAQMVEVLGPFSQGALAKCPLRNTFFNANGSPNSAGGGQRAPVLPLR